MARSQRSLSFGSTSPALAGIYDRHMSAHRVAVVVPRDFTLFELGVAVEAFAFPRPELGIEWYDVSVCTAEPGKAVAMGGLFGARIDHGIEAIDAAQTVIVPQADRIDRPAEPEVLDAIRRAYERGARLVSYCSGAFVLAAAGVLDGRHATTHWKYTKRLAEMYPLVKVDSDALYVDGGQVLTSAGTAAGIDLSLHIIGQDHGARVARHLARVMVVAPHREGGQAQFIMTPMPEPDHEPDGISRAMQYALGNLDADMNLHDLSSIAFMSSRNFSRRFREVTGTTPMKWLNHQRLTKVRELLEETDMPIERIALQTGFGSVVTLRQRFSQRLRTSPSAYRRAFQSGGLGEVDKFDTSARAAAETDAGWLPESLSEWIGLPAHRAGHPSAEGDTARAG
ncbi:AraC family transcriptional regulator [Sphaerisporangium rufum]|uniref:AraC family transcriptional regulator n=2 Tax=Sphaerisporangium rufum TaxID=1381558 RepID=A0A919R768_9ACTN|nr:AraC family transcriptional regulator [Sphaerisporangium rufum]